MRLAIVGVMNLAGSLESSARYFPDRPAVIDGDRTLSYEELNAESNRIATALLGRGLRAGDPVAICSPGSAQWIAFYFAVLKAGGAAVTLPHAATGAELSRIVADSRPRFLFATREKLEALGNLEGCDFLEASIAPGGDLPYQRLLEAGSPHFKAVERERDDTAAVLYTGGTTGVPKGVLLTHENLLASSHNVSHFERSTPEDRALCFLPLNHVFGQVHIMSSTVHSAGCLVIQPGFDLERTVDAVRRHRVTKFFAVPTIYIRLLSIADLRERWKTVRYCFSAASSMPAELVREWRSRLGLNIFESYGMTETAAMVTYNHYHRHVIGSVGTPVNTVEVRILDPSGHPLPPGEQGEICIRGPNVMKAYLNHPEETRSVIRNGWLRSGDLGVVDEDGYLYIRDRIKDLIISGGENVYPREIEELLYARPEVRECAVLGLPDEEWGERVVAVISPARGSQPDAGRLKSFLKTRLSSFKVPKEFITVSEMPKSPTGKILKKELKDQLMRPEARVRKRNHESENLDRR